jgi:spore coat protein H
MIFRNIRHIWIFAAACVLIALPLVAGVTMYSVIGEDDGDSSDVINGVFGGESDSLPTDAVITMYLTVRRGNSAEGTNHLWSDLTGYSPYSYDNNDTGKLFGVEGILQIGNESGPVRGELGFGVQVPNSVVTLRGDKSKEEAQKSFKIELKKSAGDWLGQTTILLNKHVNDGLRFRNRLACEIISDNANMIGPRTQFVHLYVNDETTLSGDGKFYDYGLFTQVEQVNNEFLANHGLFGSGSLYKAVNFDFRRHEDEITSESSMYYNAEKFNSVLESKLNKDHDKLITMLEDLNNWDNDIEDILYSYFDEDNYYNWLAFQILTGNSTAAYKDFYLYSPTGSSKFYFITWDADGILKTYEDELTNPKYVLRTDVLANESGTSAFFGSELHRRVLLNEDCRAKLDEVIEAMRKPLELSILEYADDYRDIVKQYVLYAPDANYEPLTEAQYDDITDMLYNEIDKAYEDYKTTLLRPLPFKPRSIHKEDGIVGFEWEESAMLDETGVRYTVELSSDYTFTENIDTFEDMRETSVSFSGGLKPGQYFIRVTVIGDNWEERRMSGYYEDYYSVRHAGVLCFYILPDASLEVELNGALR